MGDMIIISSEITEIRYRNGKPDATISLISGIDCINIGFIEKIWNRCGIRCKLLGQLGTPPLEYLLPTKFFLKTKRGS